MAQYTNILNRLPPNAVGRKRIQSIEKITSENFYVTGATIGGTPNYTLTLGRNGGLSDVTVNLSSLVQASSSPLTTKGDIYVFGSANTRLPVGANGYALVADSTQTTGLNWAPNNDGNYYTSSAAINSNIITGTVAGGGNNWTVDISGLTSVGTIATGIWSGTSIVDGKIASASNWNDAYNNYVASAAYSAGTLTFTQRDGGTFTASGFETGTMSSWTLKTDSGGGAAAAVSNGNTVTYVGNDGITTSNSGLSPSWSVDNTVVRTTGVQSIGGTKTFTSLLTASNGLTVSAGSALTVSGNTTLQNPLIIQTGSATKFNFKPDDQAEELLITGTKKTTAATEYAYYPRIVLDSDEDADASSQPGYPSVFFTKFGPTSIANPAGDPVGWRMAASGSAGIANAPQSLVWDYSSDQSTYSNKLILSEAGVLTAATFTGQLLGTIASTTTATTQSAGNSTTKVATTAFVANAISGGGLGTVTSVAVAGNNGISVSGSPITSNGTITLGLSNLANSVLANSTVSYGGVSLALGATDATPAFNLTDATNYEGAAIKSTGESGGSKFLREDGDGTSSWQAVPAGSPGGSTTQMQYNNAGSFGGTDNLYWIDGSDRLYLSGTTAELRVGNYGQSAGINFGNNADRIFTDNYTMYIQNNNSMIFNIDSNNNHTGQKYEWRHNAEGAGGAALMSLHDDGTLGIGNVTAINSAKLTVLDSTRQLVLAYDGSNYFNFAADGNYLNITANSTNKSIVSLRDNGNFYFNGDNIIFETASEKYFQLKGTNVLGFGSGRDFSMSASGSVFYMTSGTQAPSATPILGIKQDGSVGIGLDTPTSKLHVKGTLDIQDGNQTILMGAGNSSTSRSNDTLKLARVGLAHYHNAEEPVAMLYAASNGTDNTVVMGGGTSGMNAATRLQFATAVNDATTAGTVRASIQGDANYDKLYLGADTTLGFWRYGNRMDFYVASQPRIHLDSGTLYASAATGSPSIDLTPTAGTATYGFYGDTDTGLDRTGADTLVLLTAGTARMTISSAGNATFTEAVTLGDNSVTNTQSVGNSTTRIATTEFVAAALTAGGYGNVSKVGTPANNQIGVWTGDGTIEGNNDFTYDAGTLDINDRLNIIAAGAAGTPNIFQPSQDGKEIQFRAYSSNLDIMRLTDAGDVGIGHTAALNGAKLTVLDATRPLVLAYDTSNYSSFDISNAGGLTITVPHSFVVDSSRHMDLDIGSVTREHRFLYAGTKYGYATTTDSNTFWTIASTSTPTAGMMLSGAAGSITLKPHDKDVDIYGAVQLVNGQVTSNPGTNHLWASGSTLFWGGSQIGTTTPGAGAIQGTATAGEVAYGDGSNSITSSSNFQYDGNNLKLIDSKKAIFGTGDDLQIYHNGSNSYLDNQTGDFRIQNYASDKDIIFKIKDNTTETEVMRIDGSVSRVGIGTTAPAVKLDVRDAGWPIAAFHGTSEYGTGIQLYNTHTTAQTWAILGGGTSQSNYPLKFYDQTNSVYRMVLDNRGYLGIGTTTPDYTLELENTAPQLGFNDTNGRKFYLMSQSDKFWLGDATGGTTPLVVDSAGDIGIGTTSPNVKLHVNGDARIEAGHKLYFDDTGTGEYIYATGNDLRLHASDHIVIDAEDQVTVRASDFAWETDAASEKMRFKADTGRLGIGTNAPDQSLHVKSADNYLAKFESTDGIAEIRVQDNTKYTRLLTVGSQYKIMPNDGVELMVLDGSANTVAVAGVISATAKSFNIPHPLYKDKRLVHGSLEGPEHGIYIRGTIETEEKGCLVELPEYWSAMCEDYTVQLTPHGPYTVYIKEKLKDKVMIECSQKKFKFDYYIVGARTDETLEVVQDASSN